MTATFSHGLSMEELSLKVAVLEHKLRAKEKTIRVLIDRVDNAGTERHSAFWVLEQNIAMEAVVANRTAELREQKEQLVSALAELKGTQAKLLQAQKLEAIGQLAAGIAHEINTPTQYVFDNTSFVRKAVASVFGVLDAAMTVVDAARTGEVPPTSIAGVDALSRKAKLSYLQKQVPLALEQSLDGLGRISGIVGAMKSFSHPSGYEKRPENLREAVETTVAVARNEWKYVAEVDLDFAPDLPLVPILRNEFNQVVLNLIVNAAHAISDVTAGGSTGKGRITIAAKKVGVEAEVRISDTGGGIPEAHRKRVFEPFFTTKEVGKGTGQGLAIAYSVIVDKHGGTISFETEEGLGTTFILALPLALTPEAEATGNAV